MLYLIVRFCGYLLLILAGIYTFEAYFVFRHQNHEKARKHIYRRQQCELLLFGLLGFLVLFANTADVRVLEICGAMLAVFAVLYLFYHHFYRGASRLLLNNTCMLISVGLLFITRLSVEKGMRQVFFLAIGSLAALIIPFFMRWGSFFRKLTWLYAGLGIAGLLIVALMGPETYGAKLNITVFGFTVQPSEFIKIIFVFFLAAMLHRRHDLRRLAVVSAISAVFVLCLVASCDLGGALIYFFTYLVMLYAASEQIGYLACGFAFIGAAGAVAMRIFTHVKTRVAAWQDPLAVYTEGGYQISQALFAIGTGGWWGLGLGQGLPEKIPVAVSDFIFAAIAEEMGGIFAICLILICLSTFFLIINLTMQMGSRFFRLVSLGLGTEYALQVFLNIGGGIKFIPSTGVTLPLVSYGGSSLISTMILIGVVQGLYIVHMERLREQRERGQTDEA